MPRSEDLAQRAEIIVGKILSRFQLIKQEILNQDYWTIRVGKALADERQQLEEKLELTRNKKQRKALQGTIASYQVTEQLLAAVPVLTGWESSLETLSTELAELMRLCAVPEDRPVYDIVQALSEPFEATEAWMAHVEQGLKRLSGVSDETRH